MSFDWKKLISSSWPEKVYTYTERDTILYALSVGFGEDPMDRGELDFVFEKSGKLKAVPTQATVIAWDDAPIMDIGINTLMAVHGEQSVTIHKPLPIAGTVAASVRFPAIFDKGAGKGAVILIETTIRDHVSKELLCTNRMTVFARGDGGFDGPEGSVPAAHAIPERKPDEIVDFKTRSDQAFLYALNGDRNPLHRDPDFATNAGFPRPVLQGLCTYGAACRAILKSQVAYETAQIAEIGGRFSAPVFPGETIRTEIWRDGSVVSFRCKLPDRKDAVAFNNGKAVLR